MIAGLAVDEKIPDGPIEIINYGKDYAGKKSYIAEVIESLRRK